MNARFYPKIKVPIKTVEFYDMDGKLYGATKAKRNQYFELDASKSGKQYTDRVLLKPLYCAKSAIIKKIVCKNNEGEAVYESDLTLPVTPGIVLDSIEPFEYKFHNLGLKT